MTRRGRSLARRGIAPPHPGEQAPRRDGGQLALAQRLRRLHGQPLDRVEMAVEDPPDRAVGRRDPAHELELQLGGGAL